MEARRTSIRTRRTSLETRRTSLETRRTSLETRRTSLETRRTSLETLRRRILALALALAWLAPAAARAETITVASTTSTEQSGLFGYLLPQFTRSTGIAVKVVALGTGQALDVGRRGDADVVFVHDRPAEDKFLAEGHAAKRYDVMYNDFVLVGPRTDDAGTKGKDIGAAFRRIADAKATFISRGDRSGTNAAELRLWALAGIDVAKVKGPWYREIGQGMGPALNMASAVPAYCLSDRGTWLSFKNRGDLAILVEGDTRLFNQYGVMLVDPKLQPQVKAVAGQRFVDWLISPEGQSVIAAYKIDGQQLFFPNAAP